MLLVTSRKCRKSGFTIVEPPSVIAIVTLLVALLILAVMYARESARRPSCSNNLKQLSLPVQSYQTAKGVYPPSIAWNEGDPDVGAKWSA